MSEISTSRIEAYYSLVDRFFPKNCIICGAKIHQKFFSEELAGLPKGEFDNYLLFVKNKGVVCCTCFFEAKTQSFIKCKLIPKEFRGLKKALKICPICGKKGKLQLKKVKYSRVIYVYPYMAHFNEKLTWCYLPVGMVESLLSRS